MHLSVGTVELRGDFSRYTKNFDLLEVRTDAGRAPRTARLAGWKSSAPEGFVFSVVLPSEVTQLETEPSEEALRRALAAAETLDARWIVARTPASVTPTARSRSRLSQLVALLPKQRNIAWEPAGLWEDAAAESLAAELGVVLVRDLGHAEPAPGSRIYTRLRGLGHGGRIPAGAVDLVADRLMECEEAAVVVEGSGAMNVARALRQQLGEMEEE
ncbi:MAG: DUF72 domain-containing protein [Myxococcales bacterium]|nr:DUF72 domain-containing protein [Myxococcales bacterium]MCB9577498.1 DUF72 domain-containing protein [Polyangiaceae bacterium]